MTKIFFDPSHGGNRPPSVDPPPGEPRDLIEVGRWCLTALLLYGVYTETGKWTALALFLNAVSIEAFVSLMKAQRRKQ